MLYLRLVQRFNSELSVEKHWRGRKSQEVREGLPGAWGGGGGGRTRYVCLRRSFKFINTALSIRHDIEMTESK